MKDLFKVPQLPGERPPAIGAMWTVTDKIGSLCLFHLDLKQTLRLGLFA